MVFSWGLPLWVRAQERYAGGRLLTEAKFLPSPLGHATRIRFPEPDFRNHPLPFVSNALRNFCPAIVRSLGLLAAATLSACSALSPKEPEGDLAAERASAPGAGAPVVPASITEVDPETFYYCPVDTVRQSSVNGGGIATLTSVIRYWDSEALESDLAVKYPPAESDGHTMMQLRRIAVDEGLMAFSITMKLKPLLQLSEQLEHGRPVLVSLRFPDGTYFGNDSSVVEALAKEKEGPIVPAIEAARTYYFIVFGQSETQLLLMDPQLGVVSVDKPVFTRYWGEEKFAALLCSAE